MPRSEVDRERVVARLKRELEACLEIVLALLHGSFARGGEHRDIDVAIWLDPDRLSRDERFRYALDLSVHLQLQLGSPIDVRVLNDAPLAFRYHALQGRPLVVRDEEFLAGLPARPGAATPDSQRSARQYWPEPPGGGGKPH